MHFPDELWRYIFTYLGPTKASIELACRQAGLPDASDWYSNFILDWYSNLTKEPFECISISSTTDFIVKISNRKFSSIIIHSMEWNEEKGTFEVRFLGVRILSVSSGMGGTRRMPGV